MSPFLDFVITAIPLGVTFLFGCVGEILTEKAGHLNLGIPGIMCVGGTCGCIALKLMNGSGLPWILIAVIAILIAFEVMGWWDNVIGAVLSVLVGAFGIMCAYDLALLLSACMSFGEGMVNAGKDERGQPIHFHAAAVVRLEMRDQADKPLPDDAPVYKNAEICFVMESGRINRRKVSRLSQKQLAAIRAALEAEKRFTD